MVCGGAFLGGADVPRDASQASGELVLLSIEGPIATLTLNRPGKLNALIPEMFRLIQVHLEELATTPDVCTVILEGAGRSFCAGHDLDAIAAGDEEQHLAFEAETVDLLESYAYPTIAKIHGYCVTGGLELALACDLLVCSDDAKLGDTHGKWGLVPGWGMSARLPERIGLAMAKELSFTSRIIDGATAKQIGLVNRCVARGDLDTEVAELAAQIVRNSSESNRIFKSLYANWLGPHRAGHLESERRHQFGTPSDSARRIEGFARTL
jgi:enoyl-CoA hydratase